jgi:hypothetical protein
MNEQVLQLSERYMRLAREAGIIPREMNAAQAQAIILAGREIGLEPLQSLRTMAFINGRLTMSVQLQLALARQRAGVRVEQLTETDDSCTVTLARDGERITCTYALADARRAGLDRSHGWQKYPRQMLRWRAIGDALRIIAPDVVMGLLSPEEAETIDISMGATDDVSPAALPSAESAPEPEPEPQSDEPREGNGHDHSAEQEQATLLRDLQRTDRDRYNRVLRALHAHARTRFPDDNARRAWLHANYGVWNFPDLTLAQVRDALRLMQQEVPA